jgi:hypothetical protein
MAQILKQRFEAIREQSLKYCSRVDYNSRLLHMVYDTCRDNGKSKDFLYNDHVENTCVAKTDPRKT